MKTNNLKIILFIIVICSSTFSKAFAQGQLTGKYKLFKGLSYSFLIPIEWKIETEELWYEALPIKKKKGDTENKYIFKILPFYSKSCDSAFLSSQGFDIFFRQSFRDKDGNTKDEDGNSFERGVTKNKNLYYTLTDHGTEKKDTLFSINGSNWTGYRNITDCNCINDRFRFEIEEPGNKCETIMFFDKKHTIIVIQTNDITLDKKARNKIINSFKFL